VNPLTQTTAPEYIIGAGVSRFTVRGFAGGLLSAMGHNPVIAIRGFSGEVRGDPAVPEQASLHMKIQTASLSVENDMSDKDRREMARVMQEEVLEVTRYPEIEFQSTAISSQGNGRIAIDGNLTLHGVTRPHRMAAQLSLIGPTLRAFGDFSVRQTDYRIKLASVAGGALKLKDELKITFDIVAQARTD
jgi:polyisoprenoid-binding protein YceI